MTQSLADADETEDEFMGGLHEAFAGHEIEDLAYGAGHPSSSIGDDAEMEWWNDNDDDEKENADENEEEDEVSRQTFPTHGATAHHSHRSSLPTSPDPTSKVSNPSHQSTPRLMTP